MTDSVKSVRNDSDRKVSIYDKWRSTPEGLRDSNAIQATFSAIQLIDRAMTDSNTNRDELAEKLEVSRNRVDEILDIDQGNVRITTLARILTVCGFELDFFMKKIS